MDLLDKLNKKSPSPEEVGDFVVATPAIKPPTTTTLAEKTQSSGFNLGGLAAKVGTAPKTPQVQPAPVQAAPPAPAEPSVLESVAMYDMSESTPDTMPEDATEAFKLLIENLQKNVIGSSEGLEEAMKRVILHTQEHPSLRDNVLPEEVGVIVSALETMTGRVIEKKTSNRRKSAARQAMETDALSALDAIPGL